MRYREYFKKWTKEREELIKISTLRMYECIGKMHLLPYFRVNISDIDNAMNIRFAKHLIKKKYAVNYIRSIFSVHKLVLEHAKKEGKTSLAMEKITFLKTQNSHVSVLTKRDKHKITECIMTSNKKFMLACFLGLYAGMRAGEVCGLKWNDVDIENKRISINKTIIRIYDSNKNTSKVNIQNPKTHSSKRFVPLTEKMITILKRFETKSENYVVSGTDKPWEPRLIDYHFKMLAQRLKLGIKNFHSLRHTFATTCIELGFDYKSLSLILGHANVATTLNLYVHPSLEAQRKNMNKLNSLLT